MQSLPMIDIVVLPSKGCHNVLVLLALVLLVKVHVTCPYINFIENLETV